MQEPVYALNLITCHGRIMPRLAELLLAMLFCFFMDTLHSDISDCPESLGATKNWYYRYIM